MMIIDLDGTGNPKRALIPYGIMVSHGTPFTVKIQSNKMNSFFFVFFT